MTVEQRWRKDHTGFTLMEVLIAVLILSIGLLGLASLQANGLRSNFSSYARSQAVILANDMADRMRANLTEAVAGTYNVNATVAARRTAPPRPATRPIWPATILPPGTPACRTRSRRVPER